MVQVEKKIVGFSIATNETAAAAPVAQEPVLKLEEIHENLKRPEFLEGSTYKVKPPQAENAMYVTINDIVLNKGTEHETRRPFEIFVNSKNMEHYQWISAITLIVSAIFRKGGDCTFLVEELRSVFDPKGGYMKRGGRWMPSLVAEIGDVLEQHLTKIGLIKVEVDEHQQAFLEAKRKEFEAKQGQETEGQSKFPAGAQLCTKCNNTSLVKMDGCMTCLNCGDSKCG